MIILALIGKHNSQNFADPVQLPENLCFESKEDLIASL